MTMTVTMSPRQRYRETLRFGQPDRVPLQPGGPRESTLARWRQQGLPEKGGYRNHLLELLGIPSSEIDGIPSARTHPEVSFRMMPQFEEKVLEHRDGHYVVQDWMGAITEISDRFDYTYIRSAKDFVTRKWHKFPVENREDWIRMRSRYDPGTPGRFPSDFAQRAQRLAGRDYVVSVSLSGPFWQLREWCGFENLCLLMIEDPGLVEEMASFWTDFVSQILDRLLEAVELDELMINEDMAYKAHSMVSPAMARRFLMPSWLRWTRQAKSRGSTLVTMDSDGEVGGLLPLWVEAGIDAVGPMEVAAGNDLLAFRKRFGRNLAFWGGLDKRALAAGGAALEREVLRVVPPLFESGGYIPGCDHGVPPDISWPDYCRYSKMLAGLCGWI